MAGVARNIELQNFEAAKLKVLHQSIETPAPRAPGHGGGLTLPKSGFNALLTARRQKNHAEDSRSSRREKQIPSRCRRSHLPSLF